MSDISVTAGNVVAGAAARIVNGRAGGTITAGQPVYSDSTDSGDFKAADNNVSAAVANAAGIALHGAADGQPLAICVEGDINLGATLIVGETYIVSATAGGIAPVADISTNFVTVLGVARTAAILQLKINATGIQRAAP
jgi:hypothetical protein